MANDQHESGWQAFLDRHDLFSAHSTLISYLHFEGARPAVEAPARARSWARNTCRQTQPTSDYLAAIDDMIARDLLWVVDRNRQAEIEQHVAHPEAIGPIDIMPPIGTLQFSVQMARLFNEFWSNSSFERPGCLNSPKYLPDNSIDIYSTVSENCVEFIRDSGMIEEEHAINQEWKPKVCGPWRDHWWRLYEFGFVLNIPAEFVVAV